MYSQDKLAAWEVWFVTGSQHLYGPKTLARVGEHAAEIARGLNAGKRIALKLVGQPTLTDPDAVTRLCRAANADPRCAGLVCWMHTFSPARMWIAGLRELRKPILHLHTQYHREIPWPALDMDFMNLHQSAHGDREFGFINTRLRLERRVVVGYWRDADVQRRVDAWARAAAAWQDAQGAKIARFGDNMRDVAVTEGDKVSAQIQFGYAVNGYGLDELAARVAAAPPRAVDATLQEYARDYQMPPALRRAGAGRDALREQARIEIGLRSFLRDGGFNAFTTTFENLAGLKQLPGLAVQRLMAEGYGFGAEGDWKTAALVRAMKVMAAGRPGGVSFMEDYTYHLDRRAPLVLGAHMLEVCPTIARPGVKPRLSVNPLSIGGKDDPARLIFDAAPGPALNASLIDLGNRFRLIVNTVTVVPPLRPLPRLPVARALWRPHPDLSTAAAAWIFAGGAHHTGFTQALTVEHLEDFAAMAGIELTVIDEKTELRAYRNELRWSEAYYRLTTGVI